ncbi:hypothetical protein GGS20DRAFT_128072 [Poronia punctata]|nr:hypothetical protein GGS20DRAFT_128072 [Poronia punctata]
MSASTQASSSSPTLSDSSRFSAIWKKVTGKGHKTTSPPDTCSEPGLSRASSRSSGLIQRVSRRVVPNLPRAKTFKRQLSEERERLEPVQPSPAERRAVSVDRRLHHHRGASRSSQFLPRASAPGFFDDVDLGTSKIDALAQPISTPQSPADEKQFLSLNNVSATNIAEDENLTDEQMPIGLYPETRSAADGRSVDTAQYDAMIHDELERKWILNLSMHFRDKSKREKFFVTYRERHSVWRRVTISIDYRNAPDDSLEKELLNISFQREKSDKIYEAIRESLQDIQFYDTVTNLKLQTAEGRLHVHVVEDVNEIIQYPSVRTFQHLGCRRIRESDIEFDSHMSGFVYKVRVDGQTLIKKEIPGPDTIEEFLYEVNALNSLQFSNSVIGFHGVVVDEDDQSVKGLLISFAKQGALVDLIYDSREGTGPELPWDVRERWARQIVQGLSDLHESGFVQGDFTLSNIVIDDFGDAKIIDINRRGCPVGWEPPEALPLLDSHQRISMYIGVKSDLYQLGMVLWALATLDDEPEARRRPLRLKPDLDVPLWYRQIVESCLSESPRDRMHATTLLTIFPEMACNDAYEERVVPSISVKDYTSFENYATDESPDPPRQRTVKPRSSWPYSTVSNTQATSPSFSEEEPSYPPRGRSPPSPRRTHHGLYEQPYVDRDATWVAPHDDAVVDDEPAAEEVGAGAPGDLETTAVFANGMSMEEELEQIEANLRAETSLKNEQTQPTGGDSQAHDALLETDAAEPYAAASGQDEEQILLGEDESNVLTPTESIASEGSDDTPVRKMPKPVESTGGLSESMQRHADVSEEQVEFTKEQGTIDTDIDDPDSAYTYDRGEVEIKDMPTRLTEPTAAVSDLNAPQNDIPLSKVTAVGGVE